jgi:ABC-type lipoprotein export system ATPase subunit
LEPITTLNVSLKSRARAWQSPPDARQAFGRVVFDGRHLEKLSDRERTVLRRTSFGFVFPFGQLVPDLPAVENVAMPMLLGGAGRRASLAAWAA